MKVFVLVKTISDAAQQCSIDNTEAWISCDFMDINEILGVYSSIDNLFLASKNYIDGYSGDTLEEAPEQIRELYCGIVDMNDINISGSVITCAKPLLTVLRKYEKSAGKGLKKFLADNRNLTVPVDSPRR